MLALLAGAAGLGLLATGPTGAQEGEPSEARMEELVVTGSRIARTNLVSPSPVTQVGQEELAFTGTINVEDILNDLPQVVAGLTSATNNGNNGTATVDLRGLGTNRTLVLVNGRRFVGSSQDGTVDINNIPAALLERVEVVTGGASAVYGSDAVAGVVNFILRNDFQGAQIDANYGISSRGDGEQWDLNFTLGSDFADGRGNAVVSLGYLDRNAVLQEERAFSRVTISDVGGGELAFVGSPTAPAGRADNLATNPFPGGQNFVFLPGGGVRPFTSGGLTDFGDTYNFAPSNYLQVPQDRYNLAALINYSLTDTIQAYVEGFYVNSRVDSQLAPTPVTGILAQRGNPFITPELAALLDARPDPGAPFLIRRRTEEAGPRTNEFESQTYRFVVGVRGELPEVLPFVAGWDWDVYYDYGRVTREEINGGLIATSRFENAVNCFGAFATAGCVPLNPFGPGSISEAAADFVTVPTKDRTEVQQEVISASISGDIFDLPAGPIGAALGFEYREEKSEFIPDFFASTGDLQGGTNAGPVEGSFDVREVFGELVVPILADMPYARELSVEAGFRFSDYSNVGGVWTYKFGGSYTPIEPVRLRAVYQRAIRAPSISELFGAAQQSFEPADDPCSASENPTGQVALICQQQGLPASAIGLFQDDGQIEITFTGNPDLSEERASTWTVGAVVSPLDWLDVSVDYYSIEVEDAIDFFGGGLTAALQSCFESGSALSPACSPLGQPIVRDATGEIVPFALPQANIATIETAGLDVQMNGAWSFANGHELAGNLLFTWVRKYDVAPNPALPTVIDQAGTVGLSADQAAIPEFKVNTRFTYAAGPWVASYRLRWIDSVENRAIAEAEAVGAETDVAVRDLGAVWYHDLSAQWTSSEDLTFTVGVNNMFDRDPPLLPDSISANTDTSTYDVLGRYFFVNTSIRF